MSAEWAAAIIAMVGVIAATFSGLAAGIWRAARIEGEVKGDLRQEIAEAVHEMTGRYTEAIDQFDETLRALRQKINDVELETHKHFVSKPEFDDFRKEYREDMRDLKGSLAELRRSA